MTAICAEIAKVEGGEWPREDDPLRRSPRTAVALVAGDWRYRYTREQAAYPLASLRRGKCWAPVGRVDIDWDDRKLFFQLRADGSRRRCRGLTPPRRRASGPSLDR